MEIRFTPEMLELNIRLVEDKLRDMDPESREHKELADTLVELFRAREALHAPAWEMLD